jgi:tryptophan 2,3-dioxygenase
MKVQEKYSTVHYRNYLQLDQLLSAQKLRSADLEEKPAHEEMLFIIVHQAYELWFKQIIHELESVLAMFRQEVVDEKNIGTAVARLERVIDIQGILIEQIGIMETMTPLDFLDFRKYLFPASGFQSFQFRKIENLLGLESEQRMTYNGCPYSSVFSTERETELLQMEEDSSLFEAMEEWLERTPFLKTGDFHFLDVYKEAVNRMLADEKDAIQDSIFLNDQEKKMRVSMLEGTDNYFSVVLDKKKYEELQSKGQIRMSYKATVAALLINLYRDEPLLHLPYRLLTCFIEIDDAMTTWRYRHAQMVLRMLGNKIGTGGSTGHSYLNETAQKHMIYRDLHNISTLLIPRSELPELPEDLKKNLSFYYTNIKL